MTAVMREWLGSTVTHELKLAIEWKKKELLVDGESEIEEGAPIIKKEHAPDSLAHRMHVPPRSWVCDGSSFFIDLPSPGLAGPLQVISFETFKEPIEAILSDGDCLIQVQFSPTDTAKSAIVRKRPFTENMKGGLLDIARAKLVVTRFGPPDQRVRLMIEESTLMGSTGASVLRRPKPICSDRWKEQIKSLINELFVTLKEIEVRQKAAQEAAQSPVDRELKSEPDDVGDTPDATESAADPLLQSQMPYLTQGGLDGHAAQRTYPVRLTGVNIATPRRDRMPLHRSKESNVEELELIENRQRSAKMLATLQSRVKSVPNPIERADKSRNPDEVNQAREVDGRHDLQNVQGSGNPADDRLNLSSPLRTTAKPSKEPILASDDGHSSRLQMLRQPVTGMPAVRDHFHSGNFRFVRALMTLDMASKEQRSVLSKPSSWANPVPGINFPPANIPLHILNQFNKRVEDAKIYRAREACEKGVAPHVEPEQVPSSNRSPSMTPEPPEATQDSKLPWSSSPPQADDRLPPNSSGPIPQPEKYGRASLHSILRGQARETTPVASNDSSDSEGDLSVGLPLALTEHVRKIPSGSPVRANKGSTPRRTTAPSASPPEALPNKEPYRKLPERGVKYGRGLFARTPIRVSVPTLAKPMDVDGGTEDKSTLALSEPALASSPSTATGESGQLLEDVRAGTAESDNHDVSGLLMDILDTDPAVPVALPPATEQTPAVVSSSGDGLPPPKRRHRSLHLPDEHDNKPKRKRVVLPPMYSEGETNSQDIIEDPAVTARRLRREDFAESKAARTHAEENRTQGHGGDNLHVPPSTESIGIAQNQHVPLGSSGLSSSRLPFQSSTSSNKRPSFGSPAVEDLVHQHPAKRAKTSAAAEDSDTLQAVQAPQASHTLQPIQAQHIITQIAQAPEFATVLLGTQKSVVSEAPGIVAVAVQIARTLTQTRTTEHNNSLRNHHKSSTSPRSLLYSNETPVQNSIPSPSNSRETHITKKSSPIRARGFERLLGRFSRAYPNYIGDVRHFEKLCRRAQESQHPFLWDDFIIRHKIDYAQYTSKCMEEGSDPTPYEKFYLDQVENPKHKQGILTKATLGEALAEEEADVTAPSTISIVPNTNKVHRASTRPPRLQGYAMTNPNHRSEDENMTPRFDGDTYRPRYPLKASLSGNSRRLPDLLPSSADPRSSGGTSNYRTQYLEPCNPNDLPISSSAKSRRRGPWDEAIPHVPSTALSNLGVLDTGSPSSSGQPPPRTSYGPPRGPRAWTSQQQSKPIPVTTHRHSARQPEPSTHASKVHARRVRTGDDRSDPIAPVSPPPLRRTPSSYVNGPDGFRSRVPSSHANAPREGVSRAPSPYTIEPPAPPSSPPLFPDGILPSVERGASQENEWWKDPHTPFKEYAHQYSNLKMLRLLSAGAPSGTRATRIDVLGWRLP